MRIQIDIMKRLKLLSLLAILSFFTPVKIILM